MEGHEQYKKQFMPFLHDDQYFIKHKEWASGNDTTMAHPLNKELPWTDITQEAIRHVFNYLDQFQLATRVNCYADPWLNRYYKNDYQETHTHCAINTMFSCAYMLLKPNDDINFYFVDKTQDYWTQIGLGRFCNLIPEKSYAPEQSEGTLVIFPSHLEHFVKGNSSEDMRATISMNFYLTEDHNG